VSALASRPKAGRKDHAVPPETCNGACRKRNHDHAKRQRAKKVWRVKLPAAYVRFFRDVLGNRP
jgi:hypothetical protein